MRLAGDDVDDAAHGVGAIDRALRPAQDLDALDIVERDGGEVELVVGGRRVVDADAVDQHQRVAGLAAAQAHFVVPPGPPDSVTVTPGTVRSSSATEVGRGMLDLVARDDRDGAARLADRDRHVVGRDDDRRYLGEGRRRSPRQAGSTRRGGAGMRKSCGRSPLWIDLGGSPVTVCVPGPSGFPAGPPRGKRAPLRGATITAMKTRNLITLRRGAARGAARRARAPPRRRSASSRSTCAPTNCCWRSPIPARSSACRPMRPTRRMSFMADEAAKLPPRRRRGGNRGRTAARPGAVGQLHQARRRRRC